MEEALITITAISVLLFIGVISSFVASKIKIPDMLLLLLIGLIFGHLKFQDKPLIHFPEIFLSSVSILALAMIVFDSTARIKIKEVDKLSLEALRLVFMTTITTLVLFTAAAQYILKTPFWTSLIFSAVMIGTSPEALLSYKRKAKEVTLIKLESIFNTPITVILPFLILELSNIKSNIITEVLEQTTPFVMNIIVGIGTGIFIGLVLFKLVQHVYKEVYSPLAVIVAALLSYVLSENLGGSGVIAVTALGLFFGNAYVKEKFTLLGIETVFTKALYILVFILTGIAIKIPYTRQFLITSTILFITYTSVRFIAVWLSTRNEKMTSSELLYMSLNAPKGIATAVVVFSLFLTSIDGLEKVLEMSFAFIIYSIVLSSITTYIYQTHMNTHQE